MWLQQGGELCSSGRRRTPQCRPSTRFSTAHPSCEQATGEVAKAVLRIKQGKTPSCIHTHTHHTKEKREG